MKQRHINISNERSYAYRDMWKILYRAVREERNKHPDGLTPVHLVDIVIMYVMHYDVNPLHIRNIITRAGTICLDSPYPFPSLSELRRSELADIANGIEPIDSEYDEIPF